MICIHAAKLPGKFGRLDEFDAMLYPSYEGGDERGGWRFLQSFQPPPSPPPS